MSGSNLTSNVSNVSSTNSVQETSDSVNAALIKHSKPQENSTQVTKSSQIETTNVTLQVSNLELNQDNVEKAKNISLPLTHDSTQTKPHDDDENMFVASTLPSIKPHDEDENMFVASTLPTIKPHNEDENMFVASTLPTIKPHDEDENMFTPSTFPENSTQTQPEEAVISKYKDTKKLGEHYTGGDSITNPNDSNTTLVNEKEFGGNRTLYLNNDEARNKFKMDISGQQVNLNGQVMNTKGGDGLTMGAEKDQFIFVMDKNGNMYSADMSDKFTYDLKADLKVDGIKGIPKGVNTHKEVINAITPPAVEPVKDSNPPKFKVIEPNGSLFTKGQEISSQEYDAVVEKLNELTDKFNNLDSNSKPEQRFHHSTFLAGGEIAGAGTMKVDNGKISTISDASGHYKPDIRQVNNVIDEVEDKGTKIEAVNIHLVEKGDLKKMNASALRVQENVNHQNSSPTLKTNEQKMINLETKMESLKERIKALEIAIENNLGDDKALYEKNLATAKNELKELKAEYKPLFEKTNVQARMQIENSDMDNVRSKFMEKRNEFMEKRFEKILKGNDFPAKISETSGRLKQLILDNTDLNTKIKFIEQVNQFLPDTGKNPEETAKLSKIKKDVVALSVSISDEIINSYGEDTLFGSDFSDIDKLEKAIKLLPQTDEFKPSIEKAKGFIEKIKAYAD
jgi:hypothetical protein